jgi:putative ABC transport system ATP-binding protein
MSPVLAVRDVSKVYGGSVTALDRVSLTVETGELLAIVGPSGSGKSTLLHLMGTLDRPSSGTVEIAGQDAAGLKDRRLSALRGRELGFVFQQFHLTEGFTAADNVAMGLLYAGVPRRHRGARAAEALARVGLGHRAGHLPHQLSGGERQRVAIARALVHEPALVLADEPTGALDTETGEQVLRLLRSRCDAGAAGVLVTHEARHAAWADRVVFLRDGLMVDETGRTDAPESLLDAGLTR